MTLVLLRDGNADNSFMKSIKKPSSDVEQLHVFAAYGRFLEDIASTSSGSVVYR